MSDSYPLDQTADELRSFPDKKFSGKSAWVCVGYPRSGRRDGTLSRFQRVTWRVSELWIAHPTWTTIAATFVFQLLLRLGTRF